MARVFITGSADGLGFMAAELLLERGHEVVLHARTKDRADQVKEKISRGTPVVVGDLSHVSQMKNVAEQANRLGPFDAIIHNVGVGYREPYRIETEDGLSHVFAVNVLAPYVLTALIKKPKRLIYLSSLLHDAAEIDIDDLSWSIRNWDGMKAYSESKFMDALLSRAVARLWPDVLVNALEPGWVQTKMGGEQANDDLSQGHLTQVWLAEGLDPATHVTGGYFYHLQRREMDTRAGDLTLQTRLLDFCQKVSGIVLPGR
ncbi:SDR family NAD(P)-dependent oxidoreductase [Pseudomonas sp. HN11]|uniref:SDR family NAD(P)-dependent oxidoreductase n=1 Tax=Pseudomonas sp. HN11 TaxID=1344094 RepID=UPI001F45982D|nr:SDR family NAD(P)-dependent oxidoreductase [Pseudomonas sp. HN11]UII69884.1 SDR family NAD(P)-dependent oxidoreductase [Pseudomonas sp. HN11]